MSSIVPGYEYDIFISYRHNDNRSGWVTGFVADLKEELAATIKDPVTVYFDSNPHDGLLETHNVDKTLEGKLKCLVFIPILSQTYCHTQSFAWQHEFLAFNKLLREEPIGRDVRLINGNVADRILPVKIHDLDEEDQNILEEELGGVLRAVEFIYKEPGVNRPLNPGDNKSDNYNKTGYHNQVNKLANAIKELIYGIAKPHVLVTTSHAAPVTGEPTFEKPSIAVLPFVNRSSDPDQEYFSDGITENIIMELAGNRQLRTISRTSIMQYKNTTRSAPEISAELQVKYLLEGGVQVFGNKVRINVQLIDAAKDDHIWSKVFQDNMDDIFRIQSHVAEVVARELNLSIAQTGPRKREKGTKNVEAYNLWLKGKHAFNQWGLEGYKNATGYYKQALELDPGFTEAASSLASSYSARMSWNGDLAPDEAKKHIDLYLAKAWDSGPSVNDYLTKGFVEFFITKNFEEAESYLLKAMELGPNDAGVQYTYSYLLNMMGRFQESFERVKMAKEIDPLTPAFFNYQSLCYYLTGKYEEALATLNEGLKLYPAVLRFYDYKAKVLLALEKWEEVQAVVTKGLSTTTLRPPSMIAYLAMACYATGEEEKGARLKEELVERSSSKEKGIHIYLVYLFTARKDYISAKYWLQMARESNDVDLIWWEADPLLKDFREQLAGEENREITADFEAAEEEIVALLKTSMPPLPYHNTDHILDVVRAAEVIARTESLTEEEHKLLRLAAFYHDAGFTVSTRNHEENGVKLAKSKLPGHGFTAGQVEVICGMILATKLPQTPTNKLEKILCDADLDYLGREDFYDVGDRLYEELKAGGVVQTRREWNLVQKTFLESHRFHTNYSKSIRESSKQERLKEIVAKLINRS